MAHGHRLPGIGVRDGDVRQVRVDVGIEVDLSLLHELHHGRPGEEFRGRSDAEECCIRHNGRPVREIVISVSFSDDKPAVLHDCDGRPGNVVLGKGCRHDLIEECLHLDGVRGAVCRRHGTPGDLRRILDSDCHGIILQGGRGSSEDEEADTDEHTREFHTGICGYGIIRASQMRVLPGGSVFRFRSRCVTRRIKALFPR